MSHDRGCFKCYEDRQYYKYCKDPDCVQKEEPKVSKAKNRIAQDLHGKQFRSVPTGYKTYGEDEIMQILENSPPGLLKGLEKILLQQPKVTVTFSNELKWNGEIK